MFDLEAGVHLQEEELVAEQHELNGAGTDIPNGPARLHCGTAHRLAQVGRHHRRRCLLDDLLVAALDRALPLEEVDDRAMGIAHDLHLNVAGTDQIALQEHGLVTERSGGLPLAPATASGSSSGVATMRIPLPPPPAEALTKAG